MHKALLIKPVHCTACQQCEMACSYMKVGAFNPSKSAIKIFTFDEGGVKVPYTCTQCNEAWCMMVCPVGAITLNTETGAKVVSGARCVGCKVCTIACPFGTINYNSDKSVVAKCDLCNGTPACVEVCPTKALTYVDVDNLNSDRMQSHAEKSHTSAGEVAHKTL